MKNPESLNGRHDLKNNDYIRVEYYPGIDRYYGIINDDPALQVFVSVRKLKNFLKNNKIN